MYVYVFFSVIKIKERHLPKHLLSTKAKDQNWIILPRKCIFLLESIFYDACSSSRILLQPSFLYLTPCDPNMTRKILLAFYESNSFVTTGSWNNNIPRNLKKSQSRAIKHISKQLSCYFKTNKLWLLVVHLPVFLLWLKISDKKLHLGNIRIADIFNGLKINLATVLSSKGQFYESAEKQNKKRKQKFLTLRK